MAGHSQFANIKHKKEKEDIKRAKLFTKLTREIIVATKDNGNDPAFNHRLRLCIERAKFSNMPKDNIERAIKNGLAKLSNESIEEIRYEGYLDGVAIIVIAFTNNRNRTASEIRCNFNKAGGSLGETGSFSWLFRKLGIFEIEKDGLSEEEIMEFALKNGAEDFNVKDNLYIILCKCDIFYNFSEILEKRFKIKSSSISMIPYNLIELKDDEKDIVFNLIESLENLDDVQYVYSNLKV